MPSDASARRSLLRLKSRAADLSAWIGHRFDILAGRLEPCPDSDVEDNDDFWIDDRPIIGHCSKCGEAREDDYTCRDGGHTVPLTIKDRS